MRAFCRVITLFVGSVSLAGCVNGVASLGGSEGMDMNMQQAAERADEILDGVLGEIEPEVKWTHDTTSVGSCDVTRRRAVMTIVSPERRGNFLGVVDRAWRASGYRMKSINNDPDVPAIFAQTEDGFGVSLIVGGEGQVFFEVDTPCVEESEVAESTTQATAPTYEGMEHIPRPNIRSPFWSAGAP
uniref:Lipoprotein n=4 Tax=Streptomyces TaxID=1883 RepID=A0A8D3WGS3_STRFA